MSVLRVQHILHFDSGLPSDVSVNDWHFGTDGDADEADAGFAATAVKNFYQHTGTAGLKPRNRLASTVNPSNTEVKVYRLNDATPRVPLYAETYDLGGVGADSLPSEVACCLSFEATKVSGELQRRKRGRIYFGPLAQGALAASGGVIRVTAEMQGILLDAANALHDEAITAGISWVVFSRLNGLGATRAVTSAWVDNAVDIQRRRGEKATSRTTMAL